MRVLFDQATPLPIRAHLDQHVVSTASQQGWDTLRNGDLLNMPYQQNLAGRKIAVVINGRRQWPQLRPHVQRVVEALNTAAPGSYVEVDIPSI